MNRHRTQIKNNSLTVKRNKTTKQNDAKLKPIVSTTILPITGPNKALL